MERIKSCAIISHSPMRFAWGFDEDDDECQELKRRLLDQIALLREHGIKRFYTACDCSAGLYAAEMINGLKEKDTELELICVIPHEEQATKWAPYLRERYFNMLEKCSRMEVISDYKCDNSQMLAYERIVSRSEVVLAVYDPVSSRGDSVDRAIEYAKMFRKTILFIHPDTFKVTKIVFDL